jgi:hypothetical protein
MTIVIVFIGITKLPSAHKLITMVDKNGPLNDTASVGGIQKRSFCCGAGQPGVACWSMTVRCLRMNQKYFYAADHLNSVAPEHSDSARDTAVFPVYKVRRPSFSRQTKIFTTSLLPHINHGR